VLQQFGFTQAKAPQKSAAPTSQSLQDTKRGQPSELKPADTTGAAPSLGDKLEPRVVVRQNPQQPGTPATYKYVGAKNSNKYHDPNCKWVKMIYPNNRIYFKSAEEAKAKGYRPCPTCIKPEEK
jgi:hypothetical protein